MKKHIKHMKKYFNKNKHTTNEKANKFMDEVYEANQLRATAFLSLDGLKVSKPLVIVTPDMSKKYSLRYRVNKTEKGVYDIQYNYAIISTLFLNENSLFYHQSAVDFITGQVSDDLSGEVNFSDVVQIQTILSEEINKERVNSLQLFLHLKDGDEVVFPLRKQFLNNFRNSAEILSEKEQYVIDTIKKAFRALK